MEFQAYRKLTRHLLTGASAAFGLSACSSQRPPDLGSDRNLIRAIREAEVAVVEGGSNLPRDLTFDPSSDSLVWIVYTMPSGELRKEYFAVSDPFLQTKEDVVKSVEEGSFFENLQDRAVVNHSNTSEPWRSNKAWIR